MHIGLATTFQNPHNRTPDYEVYQNEMRLTDLAEPLGFQSIWSVEHHFTDYTMVPDVLQFLAWVAARTTRVEIGSMVVVLPWHDPLRVTESVAMLDNLCGGRFVLGLGRGLARVEFEGFRVPMEESRGRFREGAELLLQGLEQGFCEYDGRYYRQPRRDLRPAPLKSFKGRTYCATVSPDSMQVVAEFGLGLLILPQKPWEVMIPELDVYRDTFRTLHGVDAPPPIVSTFTVCHEDPDRARELAERHLRIYHDAMLRHYEIGVEHFADIQGYEYYAKMSHMLNKVGAGQGRRVLPEPASLRHARAVPGADPGPAREERLRPLHGPVQLWRHALRRGGAQPAPLRRQGPAGPPAVRGRRLAPPPAVGARGRRRPQPPCP